MPRKKKAFNGVTTPTRRVLVSPWRDPATGEVYFTCLGPMNFNKGMAAKLTRTELKELIAMAQTELDRTASAHDH
ncbi:MAG: hypothetical protein OIF56_15055 [Cohaesibacter sp.]|nr:hypothetical protein [Cohaesibacter sp.]